VNPKQFDDAALELLQEVNWTGNIRELRNVVERLIILSDETITAADVQNYVMPTSAARSQQLQEVFERFSDAKELHQFIEQEFANYKSN